MVLQLKTSYQQAFRTGNQLIELRDQQSTSIADFLDMQSQFSASLNDVISSRPDDPDYQTIVSEMQDACAGYLAHPPGFMR